MDDRNDVVVVGGGLAGLVAGAFAARAGLRTVVLDAHALGGRARTSQHDEFRFNQGPHALYEGCEAMTAMDELGVAVPGGPPSTRIGVIVNGRREHFPAGVTSLLRTRALRGRGRLAAAKLLATFERLHPAEWTGRSVNEWLSTTGIPDDTAAIVRILVRVSSYVEAPDLLDAGAAIQQAQRGIKGVRYLDGGWQTMVDGVRVAATQAGATIVDHRPVNAVRRETNEWLVTTSSGEVRATNVILAGGGPSVAAKLLGIEVGRLGDPGPVVRAACLDLGLRRPARELLLLSTDASLYYSTHMPPAELGPSGTVVAHVARYLAPDETLTRGEGRSELWAHARRAGVDESGVEVLSDRYLHDMTVTHGMPLARRGGFAGRPPVAIDGLPGAFLAGDWVGDTAMLTDAAVASARRAVELAVVRSREEAGMSSTGIDPPVARA